MRWMKRTVSNKVLVLRGADCKGAAKFYFCPDASHAERIEDDAQGKRA
jgi:hypothetical protein